MKWIKILLVIILMIGVTGCGMNHAIDKKDNNKEITNYERQVLNSTVNITTSSGDFGAGFIYDKSYIITNYHVIYQDNNVIKVTTYNKEVYNASLVDYEVNSDIAVLKIDKELESIELGDSDKVRVGDKITAIGNPDGDLSFSEASGKVLEVDIELLDQIDKDRKYIWYDGDAVSGYSGGPVYNQEGKVIGILNARYTGDLSQYEFNHLCGIIPINKVKTVIQKLLANH